MSGLRWWIYTTVGCAIGISAVLVGRWLVAPPSFDHDAYRATRYRSSLFVCGNCSNACGLGHIFSHTGSATGFCYWIPKGTPKDQSRVVCPQCGCVVQEGDSDRSSPL